MELWTPKVGTFVRTERGQELIVGVSRQSEQYLLQQGEGETCRQRWVDIETILPEEYGENIRDPEAIEKFLNGEPLVPETRTPKAAVAIHCAESYADCSCTWCYHLSSNDFHMRNKGQCECVNNDCVCQRS